MLKPCDSLSIHVNVPFGTATLNVVGSSNNAVLGVNDEAPNGVSAYQLQEGGQLINMSLFLTTDIYTSLKKKMR